MALEKPTLAYICSSVMVAMRLVVGILTPLLLDSITPFTMPLLNISVENHSIVGIPVCPKDTPAWQRIDPLVQIAVSMGMDSLVMGIAVIITLICFPGTITQYDRKYPKRHLIVVGLAQSASALMFQYSSPGTRTAPYLRSFLGNLSIPFAFILRFMILRKRPSRMKIICSLVVLISGMASLIPTFVPGIESAKDESEEGGATGSGRFIWPLILVASSIPHAVSNIVLERSVKDQASTTSMKDYNQSNVNEPDITAHRSLNIERCQAEHIDSTYEINVRICAICHRDILSSSSQQSVQQLICDCQLDEHRVVHDQTERAAGDDTQTSQAQGGHRPHLNMLYTLFWTFTSTFLGVVVLFWVDFIPGFGMQRDIKQFLPQVAFNFRCILGMTDVCGVVPIALAWGRMAAKTTSFIMAALMLRYGEGANFYVLISASMSPIRLMFWSLFEEHPFHWNPMIHVGTWFAIATVLVQLPAIVLYERSSPEVIMKKTAEIQRRDRMDTSSHDDALQPLLHEHDNDEQEIA